MIGKQKMTDELLQSAKKTAAAMIEEATEESEAAVEKIRAMLETSKAEHKKEADEAAERTYKGRLKLGELEAGKVALKAKQQCVSAVYEKVREIILSLKDADYLALLSKLIQAECEDGDEIIAAASDSKRVTAEFVKKLSQSTKKKLTLSKEKGEFCGGVILRGEKYDRDLTVDAIVEDLKGRTVTETVKKLGL